MQSFYNTIATIKSLDLQAFTNWVQDRVMLAMRLLMQGYKRSYLGPKLVKFLSALLAYVPHSYKAVLHAGLAQADRYFC